MRMPLHPKFLCPVRGQEGEIQRDSTLNPIIGFKRRAKTLSDRILWVQKLWQRRVHDLEYFEPGLAKKAFFCNPSFCYTRDKRFHCGLRNLCPFCYSRRVSGLFANINEACVGQEYQVIMRHSAVAMYFQDREHLTETIRNVITFVQRKRPKFIERSGAAGSVTWQLFTVLNDQLFVHSRQLYIFHDHQAIPEFLYADPHFKMSNCFSHEKTILARQISKCFSYPNALLFGDAPLTKLVLETMENHRFFNTTGILRKRTL